MISIILHLNHIYNFLPQQSSVCARIMEKLGQEEIDCKQRRVAIINQDSFYRELDHSELEEAKRGEFNFDHPGIRHNYILYKAG